MGLAGRVSFHGTEPDTDVIWRQIQIFVLSSRFEGFPNVLCEAMAHGLACVSFDCPYGPGEIIRPQIDGLLVPPEDPELLAEALQKLMLNAELRQELGTKAGEIAERFPADKTFQLWEGILAAAARGSRK